MSEQSIGALATKIVDRWAWWQGALKNPDAIGQGALAVHENEPQQGFFRVRIKGGDWEPVAIWWDEETGQWLAYRNGKEVRDVPRLWTWACRNPVTSEAYDRAMDGGGWADEPEKAPSIGHNSGEADPFDATKIELLGEIETAASMLAEPVTTKDQADKLGIWITKIRDIGKRADDLRKVEKQPFLDGGRAVDQKWKELTDRSADEVAKLKSHLKPYIDEQSRLERERQRKATEEAERLRREAEERAAKRDIASEPTEDEIREEQQRIREAEQAAKARNVSVGRTGAKVATRKVKVGVVEDYEKAAIALVRMGHAEFKEVIDQMANRAAKSGMPFEGMRVEIEERI